MGRKTLQELSQQYADGEISKPEYRQQRTALINEITGDETPTDLMKSNFSSPSSRQGKSDPQLKTVVIVVLLLAAMLIFYFSSSVGEAKKASSSHPDSGVNGSLIHQSTKHVVPAIIFTAEHGDKYSG